MRMANVGRDCAGWGRFFMADTALTDSAAKRLLPWAVAVKIGGNVEGPVAGPAELC